MLHGLRAAQHVGHAHVDDVKPALQQRDVGRRLVTEELAVPDPRPTRRRLLGCHHQDRLAVHLEVVALEAVPVADLAGKVTG